MWDLSFKEPIRAQLSNLKTSALLFISKKFTLPLIFDLGRNKIDYKQGKRSNVTIELSLRSDCKQFSPENAIDLTLPRL